MKTSALAMLMLTACHRVFDLDEVRRLDAGPDDGCFGKYGQDRAGLVRICLEAVPDKPLDLPAIVDTTNCAITAMQSNGIEVCVLAGTTVTVSFAARIHGARPLVVIAARQLVISEDGVIDVSGRRSMAPPAGANVAGCSAPSQNAMNISSGSGAGGGAGGALSATGGNGGTGSISSTPRAGGVSLASVAFDGVRGGCRGGRGGSTSYAMGGAGGSSGGALYLIAGESIVVRGVINVSGEGGGPGDLPAGGNPGGGGGGGGGSGGLIALDAPSIELVGAHLVASGGGGGGGGGTGGGATAGQPGAETAAVTGQPVFAALGGPGGLPGGSSGGGAGDGSRNQGIAGDSATAGAGGGGGSTGYVRLYAASPPVIDATSYIVPSL